MLSGKKGFKMHISIRWLKLLICKTQPGDELGLELTFIFQNIISVLFYILHIESYNSGHFTNFFLPQSEDWKITSQWVYQGLKQNNQGINKKIKLDPLQHKNYQNKDNKQCLFDWTRDHKGKNRTYLLLLMRITIRMNPWTSERTHVCYEPHSTGKPNKPCNLCISAVCVCN